MFAYYSLIIAICWMALAVLCILVHENGRIEPTDKRMLRLTYILIGVSALAEWAGHYLNGLQGQPAWPLMLAKCMDYILTPMAGATLAMQMGEKNRWRRLLIGLMIGNILLQVVSCFTGWMVTIDESGHYSHGPFHGLYVLVYLSVIAIVGIEFILYGKRFRRQNRLSLYAILLLIVAGIAIQEFFGSKYRTVYLGLTLGASLMYIHYNEYTQLKTDDFLRMQRQQIDTDPMTGLGSRSSYVHDLNGYDAADDIPADLAAFMIDINGLKAVNDSLGHEAGDELICGAAACIREVLDEFGRCYRTGGDEFVVLAKLNREAARRAIDALEQKCADWRGELAHRLKVSAGFAHAEDYPGMTCQQLVQLADRQMYEAKAAYYSQHDRRKRRSE